MGAITHSIEVEAPLRAVYRQWTRFEEFPHFMEGIEEVRQEGENRLFWRARMGGEVREWQTELTKQISEQMIAWDGVEGSSHSGKVTFEKLGSDLTRINATIEPDDFLEKGGLGIPSDRVQGDLKRFRDYIEQRGQETIGWRGQMGEEVLSSSSTPAAEGLRSSPVIDRPDEPKTKTERLTGSPLKELAGESSIEVPLSEEELEVGKRWVDGGKVKIHKVVTTEIINVAVELKREDAVIERVPAHEIGSTDKASFQEERIVIPLRREEAVVQKETQIVGGVRVRKTEGIEKKTIHETLRRENLEVDRSNTAGSKIESGTEVPPAEEEL